MKAASVYIEWKVVPVFIHLQKTNEMKRVTISPYQAGLVFKNGVYKRTLGEGKYWLMPSEKLEVYDMTKPFVACSRRHRQSGRH